MQVDKWQDGLNKIIDHIVQLVEDGDTLLKKNSYAHAYFLFFTTLEEIATANFILARIENPDPKNLKEILYEHKKKIPLTVRSLYPLGFEELPDLIDILKESKDKKILMGSQEDLRSKDFKLGQKLEKKEDLWHWRNRAIYTILNETGTDFLTPQDITLEIGKKLRERIDVQIAELRAYRDTYFSFKDKLAIVKKVKDKLNEKKIINQSINLGEFVNVVLKGSLEEITKFKNISPELKDLFVTIYSNKDIDESVLEKYIKFIQNYWQNLAKIDEPQSEIEKNINEYYKERLSFYKPDYFEKDKSDFQKLIEVGMKKFVEKIVDKGSIDVSEKDEFMAIYPQILPIILGLTEDNEKLINTYKEKLKENPEDVESLKNLANLYYTLTFYKEAYDCCLKLYNLDRNNLDILYALTEIDYNINQNYKKAIKNYKKILKQNPNVEEIYFNLGHIYESKGKYKKAIKYYFSVILLNFESDESVFRIGQIYYNRKETQNAYFYLNIALKINPLHEEANKLLKNLLSNE